MTEEKSKMPKGCIIGLAVAGGLLLLIMITLGVVYFYRTEIRNMAVGMVEDQIVAAEPQGYTEAQIHRIFELYVIALDSGNVEEEQSKEAYAIFQDIFEDKVVTDEEALRLLNAMSEITADMDGSALPAPEEGAETDDESDDDENE